MSKRRTTIIDVAQHVGVSPKTVSRVLNKEKYVREDVREKVQQAIEELAYRPNINARSLIAQKNYLIGLTYERPSPSYVVELQKGSLERLEETRYRLAVLPFHDSVTREEGLVSLLSSAGLDGVLLAPPSCDQQTTLDALERHHIAYARITPHNQPKRGIVAAMDEVAAARDIAAHLLELGHTRIGIIKGPQEHKASFERTKGYEEAFEAAGVPILPELVEQGDFTFPTGHAAALRLLDRARPPSAILAQNDDMAAAAILAARENGLEVPQDISICGFDDSEISRLTWPQLTTIHQPVREMAWDAADRLVQSIEGGPDGPVQQYQQHAHRIMIRGSTAPPAA